MMKRFFSIILMIAIVVALLYFLQEFKTPRNTYMWKAMADAGHFPLFGILSLVVLRFSRLAFKFPPDKIYYHYLLTFMIAGFLGALSEAIQIIGPRDADLADFARDLIGAFAFLAVFAFYDPALAEKRRRWIYKFKVTLITAVIICTAIPFWSVTYAVIAYQYRDNTFPVICTFDSYWEKPFYIKMATNLEITDPPAGWKENNSKVGKVEFKKVTYPGFHIQEPYSDWRGYKDLCFDIYNDSDTTINLYFRLHDTFHSKEYNDRYNNIFSLEPGLNQIRLPLTDIENAPVSRKMDMTAISTFGMFANQPQERFSVYFDNFRLE